MKRGFTLVELLIVIIIVGILSTVGFTQYTEVVERSRGVEARQITGQLKNLCAALYMGNNVTDCSNNNLGLGTGNNEIPTGTCKKSHYFMYSITTTDPDKATFSATRCKTGGKAPDISGDRIANLTVDYGTGITTWVTTNGY